MSCEEGGRSFGNDFIAFAAIGFIVERADIHDASLGEELHPALLGEVEVVLVESIFGAVAATDHAAAAGIAGCASGAFALEIGVGVGQASGFTLGSLENPYAGSIEGRAHSGGDGDFFQKMIGGTEDFVLGYAEHARRGVVMTGHLGLPVREALPGAAFPNFIAAAVIRCWRR